MEAYSRDVLRIRSRDAQIIPLRLNYPQQIVHRKISEQRKSEGRVRAIVLKARQEGVSTYVAGRFFRRVQLTPNIEALVIADERKRGQKLFQIYKRFDKFLPDDLRPRTRYATKGTQLVYDSTQPGELGLGSSIEVETAKDAEAGRATTIQLCHISEIAFWENPEDVWTSLLQAVPDDDSEIIVESTANGVGNFFHGLWEEAAGGESGYLPIFLPWWILPEYSLRRISKQEADSIIESVDPYEREAQDQGFEYEGRQVFLSVEQLGWRRRTIKERFRGDLKKFRQEFPSNPEEAFIVSGNCFFDEDKLALYRNDAQEPLFRANIIQNEDKAIGLDRGERAPLRVWNLPTVGHVYVIFADTATGRVVTKREEDERGGTDFSCADVFDVTLRKTVAQYHGRVAPEMFARDLYRLGYLYCSRLQPGPGRPALLGVESNHSSGETVIRILADELRYPALYTHTLINRRNKRRTRVIGWVTSAETRQPMLDEGARAIREESVDYPVAEGVREMFSFVWHQPQTSYNPRTVPFPAAQEGAHDDRVIAFCGSLEMARHARLRVVDVDELPQYARADTPTGM